MMSNYRQHEDLISVGAYRPGTNPAVDRAIDRRDQIDAFLRQRVDERGDVRQSREALLRLAAQAAAEAA